MVRISKKWMISLLSIDNPMWIKKSIASVPIQRLFLYSKGDLIRGRIILKAPMWRMWWTGDIYAIQKLAF